MYVKIRSAAQKQCSRRQLYGKFCNLPQFIQFSCRPDSSVKYAKHWNFIIMKKFMRLILYVILDVFIQGGGAGTGLLWAAQVKFKWELSPYCISCKFDANAILGVTAPPLWTPSCLPRRTEVVATEAMELQELHCSADQTPTHSRWFFWFYAVDEIWSAEKIVKIKSLFRWEIDVAAPFVYLLLRIECSPWTVPWRWDAAWQEPGQSRQTPYLIARFDKYLIARFDQY